jgi:hypothetical protein
MIITNHAVQRFREHTGVTYSDDKVRRKILKFYQNSHEVHAKPEYRVAALLNHDLQEARYYKYNWDAYILVVCGENIVTMHRGTAKRWERV